jgi:hypothetical protein
MVVPLIALGSATKLAFATAATHRTRAWWLPGSLALVVGTCAALHASFRPLGIISIVLGTAAVVAARWLRSDARGDRRAPRRGGSAGVTRT